MSFVPELAQIADARHIQCRQVGDQPERRNAQSQSHGRRSAIASAPNTPTFYFVEYFAALYVYATEQTTRL